MCDCWTIVVSVDVPVQFHEHSFLNKRQERSRGANFYTNFTLWSFGSTYLRKFL